MLGADYYETEGEVASLVAEGRVPIGIGENSRIKWSLLNFILPPFANLSYRQRFLNHFVVVFCRGCIIDKNARIGKNVVIENSEVSFIKLKFKDFAFILIPG